MFVAPDTEILSYKIQAFVWFLLFFFGDKMVGLIIPRAWIVLFQLTSQVSFLHAALYSYPGECRFSLNVELGMTYSNCCHLKFGPIGVS